MKMMDVKIMAREMGLKPGKLRKIELVRTIQKEEGNIPCFATERVKICNEDQCLWREDCVKSKE